MGNNSKANVGMIFLIVLAILLGLTSCTGGGSSSKNTCKSCGRSWEAGDVGGNYKNISRTGMCKNCYNNYNWAQGALGK